MEKVDLTKQFADRLRAAMLAAGFPSQRSTSGVCIHTLAEITGHSVQICRKYLRGEAIPEPLKLVEISSKLNVSPGWLLFGTNDNAPPIPTDKIIISKAVLQYVFSQAALLYNNPDLVAKTPDFLLELVNDVSQIDADGEQLKQILDLALSSIRHFSR